MGRLLSGSGTATIDTSDHSGRATEPTESLGSIFCATAAEIFTPTSSFVRVVMRDELFFGFSETGWDAAPWDVEPTFTADELRVLLNPALSVAEAADRVGCVEHDVRRLRRTA